MSFFHSNFQFRERERERESKPLLEIMKYWKMLYYFFFLFFQEYKIASIQANLEWEKN